MHIAVYIYIYIYNITKNSNDTHIHVCVYISGGVLSAMVILIWNEIGDPSSKLAQSSLHFTAC